jgi:hypothetical protein
MICCKMLIGGDSLPALLRVVVDTASATSPDSIRFIFLAIAEVTEESNPPESNTP